MSPKLAAWIAAFLLGRADIAPKLVRICMRESRCQAVGVHERDAWLSRASWRGQVRLGHIEASCQPYVPRGWATRGAFGLNAAAHWQYLPACYEPWWLDVSLVSALIAARKWLRHCDGGRHGRRWC